MNSRERMSAAMGHGTTDTVPVMCQLSLGHYFLNSGYKPSEIWFDSDVFAKALVAMQKEYRFDGILINLPGRPANWRDKIKRYENRGDREYICWKNGLETIIPHDDNPQTYRSGQMPLERVDYKTVDVNIPSTFRTSGYVWNTWHIPELWDVGPDSDLSDCGSYPEWFTNTVRKVRQMSPDVSIHPEVFSPFTHLMELFGYEQALFALIDEPQKCHKLLEIFSKQVLAEIKLYAGCSPDAILVSSAFAGAGFISRNMYKEFVSPYENILYRAIRLQGLKSYVHTCGAIGDRLDLMAETDVDGIDTLDPPPLGTVNLAEAKAKFGKRFFFKGNLDSVNEMLNSDDEKFENAVKNRLDIGKNGGGYILSSACSVSPYVKPERLKRLALLAKKYGSYQDPA